MQVKKTNDIVAKNINALIYGPSGVGKTTLGSTLPDKTLIISLEAGLLSLMNHEIDYVEVDPTDKIGSLRRILIEATGSDYQTLFIDSLTEISQAFLDVARKEFSDARQTMLMYGLYNQYMTSFLKHTRDMEKNIFFTCLQKDDKDDIGRITHTPDMIGSISSKSPAYFDFVFALIIFEKEDEKVRAILTDTNDGYIAKDRSGKLDQYEKAHLGNIINKVFSKE